ncbi:MAG: hypothetical protein WCG93_03505 [Paludibacter sp.]
MKKLIDSLIMRLEIERTQCFRAIENMSFKDSASTEDIQTGKIMAYDFCINELVSLLENEKLIIENQTKVRL